MPSCAVLQDQPAGHLWRDRQPSFRGACYLLPQCDPGGVRPCFNLSGVMVSRVPSPSAPGMHAMTVATCPWGCQPVHQLLVSTSLKNLLCYGCCRVSACVSASNAYSGAVGRMCMQAVQNFTATDPYYLNNIILYTNITAFTVVDGPPLYNVFTP